MDEQPKEPPKKGHGEQSENVSTEKAWHETAVILARLSGIGWFVVASIGLGVAGGWFLDSQFDTRPVFILIGLGIGVLAAFTGMIRLLSQFGKKQR